MPPTQPAVFGKRNAPRSSRTKAADGASIEAAAIFAAARAETTDAADARPSVVPRSFTAAFLAGLVVGCSLAGFDVTGRAGASRVATVAALFGTHVDTTALTPALVLLGLLGGARAGAITMMLVHTLLDRARHTGHAAYAMGGAAASACLASALWFGFAHPPAHGWLIECLAGGGAGFFYRVFAGARPAH